MDTQEASEHIQTVISLTITSLQMAEGLMEAIEEVKNNLDAAFSDHRAMGTAVRQAHNRAASSFRHLRDLKDEAERFQGLLPR